MAKLREVGDLCRVEHHELAGDLVVGHHLARAVLYTRSGSGSDLRSTFSFF
jgi:hypothetical protein